MRGVIRVIIIAAFSSCLPPSAAFTNQWSLSNMMVASRGVDQANLALTGSVAAAASIAMEECSKQFATEVWNCPVTSFRSRHDEHQNNRETAYITAITAAAVSHTITRNCSQGGIQHCECEPRYGRPRRTSWQWGGCSANVYFGEQVSRQFLDTRELGNSPKSLANLHNNQAGRVAVRKTLRRLCKCHGVSGSCATQTCWRQLADFPQVGKYLKRQYKRALRVDYNAGSLDRPENLLSNRIDRAPRSQRVARAQVFPQQQQVKKRKLVFLQSSPDYCRSPDLHRMNATAGYKGVVGRTCKTDPNSRDPRGDMRACTRLCRDCGLYIHRKEVEVITSCNCRFEWCCKVTCESCHKTQTEITCTSSPPIPAHLSSYQPTS